MVETSEKIGMYILKFILFIVGNLPYFARDNSWLIPVCFVIGLFSLLLFWNARIGTNKGIPSHISSFAYGAFLFLTVGVILCLSYAVGGGDW